MHSTYLRLGALTFFAAVIVACTSGSTGGFLDGGASTISAKGEQQNGACPSSPSELLGSGAIGTSCTTYADCRASCCTCEVGSLSYVGAACIDGVCADKADSCFRAKSASFCPGDPVTEDAGTRDGSRSDGGPTDDGGPPPPDPTCGGAIDGCWQTCIANSTSTSTCASTCAIGNGIGCYALCAKNLTSTSTCTSTCGTATPTAERACYDVCIKNVTSTSTCASTCGVSTSCGKVGCFDLCIKNLTSTSTCASTCGTTGPACTECGTAETPRDACYRVCAKNSTSTSTCASICGP